MAARSPGGKEPALGNNRGVEEKDSGGYVQADFNTTLLNMPFRGNFGVRYVKTDQSSSGYTYVSGSPVALSTSRTYDDTLPSMNLVLEPRDNFLVRFGAAKVMSRPDLGSLTPGATVSVSGATRSVTALAIPPSIRSEPRPTTCRWNGTSSRVSLLGVAVFRKDIGSFVQTLQTNTGPSPATVRPARQRRHRRLRHDHQLQPSTLWTFSTAGQHPRRQADGFEINYQQPFSFLPGLWATPARC
jgi:iron complex outermembrane receptor protein